MPEGVTDSQFYMWRTLFAVAHADNVVSNEELRFMAEALDDIPFSDEQQAILNEDVKTAQDIEKMFAGITDVYDQARFFQFARELVHIDGEYGKEEQAVMLKLEEMHLKCTNLDELVGSVGLEFEDDSQGVVSAGTKRKKNFKDIVYSYRDEFLKNRFQK
ncbi:MAG: TerB family tellurite resistance protein [Rhodospirillales bacterium]|nr:TerB family tellurite resistance protein [Alphaproteobacteria bacterium]MCB9981319.1 TerB family tellurite resistance protein [Rhodospirillales bacterium]